MSGTTEQVYLALKMHNAEAAIAYLDKAWLRESIEKSAKRGKVPHVD